MSEPYSHRFRARWADMDFNAHMANSAYLDVAPDVRLMFFEDNGFPPAEFSRLGIGPVIFEDRLHYFKELRLLESFDVTLELDGLSPDGRKFRLRNDILRQDGELAARLTTTGGWLDIAARRLVPPPPQLLAALERIPTTPEFERL